MSLSFKTFNLKCHAIENPYTVVRNSSPESRYTCACATPRWCNPIDHPPTYAWFLFGINPPVWIVISTSRTVCQRVWGYQNWKVGIASVSGCIIPICYYRLMEHLDSLAGSIAYKHMLGPDVHTLGRIQERGYYIVTASVDRSVLTYLSYHHSIYWYFSCKQAWYDVSSKYSSWSAP